MHRSWRQTCVTLTISSLVAATAPVQAPAGSSPSYRITILGLGGDPGVPLGTLPIGAMMPPSPPKAEDPGGLYVVKPGDTLSELAERFLGSASLWPRIYNMNRDLIEDPDLILVGWKLRIPGRNGAAPPGPASRDRSGPPPTGASSRDLENWKGGKLPPDRFIDLIGPVARAVYRRTGVPASVTLAQAILETGWGDATIGDAKNLFGIKGTGPAGTLSVPTQEFENGRYVTIRDNFRKYHSWEESVEDHAQFFQENSRYKPAFNYSNDADRFAREIAKAGYATDPKYADKLIDLMKEFDLYRWDR